ncbi:hypothetical protein [Arthrobacter sp. S41]|uniref:hypothetical protein n=1 Tax=Arthrobacter sp. S41 TaxID=2509721 RepID=UPI0010362AED|nr:hypothetical protein [Arthrobacter sp. S41]TAP28019.1 hypothetical protein EYR88_06800 [Arthrobacter sp. S41]
MKWLTDTPVGPQSQRTDRFVITKLDNPVGTPAPEPSQLPDINRGNEPVCTIVSNDPKIIEICAAIAVGAAVRIIQCTEPASLSLWIAGPVLWGSDMAIVAGHQNYPVDVLVGLEPDASHLWALASRIPKARVALLPSAGQWLGEYLGLWAMRAGHGHTLAVSATAGGLGTTTLAMLLAHAGTLSGLRSVLIDLDPHSQSLWPCITTRAPVGVGWEELVKSGGALAAHQLAETLPKLRETSVLTWSQANEHEVLEEQLLIRLLAAARQGFDFVVLDTGRAVHPQQEIINQFLDRHVFAANNTTIPKTGETVLCGESRLRRSTEDHAQILGSFPLNSRIIKATGRGELLDCFKSRTLRQGLADFCLIPQVQEQRS